MLEFLHGKIVIKRPDSIIMEVQGVGYLVHISLFTFEAMPVNGEAKLLVHSVIREDAHLLYGFATEAERAVFRLFISVSGVGPNTARLLLSSHTPAALQTAILHEDAKLISSAKGIGAKTAQRLIVELRDKVGTIADAKTNLPAGNSLQEEAFKALLNLGVSKAAAEKAIFKARNENPQLAAVEDLLREALRFV